MPEFRKKLMIQFQQNTLTGWTEGQKDGKMDGGMDRPYFIGLSRLQSGSEKST